MKRFWCILICFILAFSALPTGGIIISASSDSDFSYTTSGGEAVITGYSGISDIAEIPSELGGYPVTSIGELAFYSCSSLKELHIPSSIKSIGSQAFMFCKNLSKVYIEDITSWAQTELVSYHSSPFQNSPELYVSGEKISELNFEEGISEIKNYTFCYLTQITEITLPEGVKSIGNGAFRSCSALTTVKLPKTLENIGEYTFFECTALWDITLPDNLLTIGQSAFDSCALTEIIIPDMITEISSFAFADNAQATFISIGQRVDKIASYAFSECTKATVIYIGSAVKTIGAHAFYNVGYGKSKSFYYCGTEAEWDNIDISTTANTPITSAKYLGHPYSADWVIDSEATLVSEGSKSQACLHCGQKGATTEIPKLTPDSSHLVWIRRLLLDGISDNSADLDGDGVISIKDLISLKKALAELGVFEGLWIYLDKTSGKVAYIDFENGMLLSGTCVQDDSPSADMPSFTLDGVTYSVTSGTYGSYSRFEATGKALTLYPYPGENACIVLERTALSTLTVTAADDDTASDFPYLTAGAVLTKNT